MFPKAYGELTNELLGYLGADDPTLIDQVFAKRRDERIANETRRLADKTTLASLILAAGFTPTSITWALWIVAFVLHWATPYFTNPTVVDLRSRHFVERHAARALPSLVACPAPPRNQATTWSANHCRR